MAAKKKSKPVMETPPKGPPAPIPDTVENIIQTVVKTRKKK